MTAHRPHPIVSTPATSSTWTAPSTSVTTCFPGVAETIAFLRERGATIRYLSNNPTRDPAQYQAKLDHLGLPTPLADIVNTVVSTVNWLRDFAPDAVLFPIARSR